MVSCGIVLYCSIVNILCDCVRETEEREEEVQWYCCRLYPFIISDGNKRTRNFCVDVAHHLGEPHYICVSM